MELIVHPAGMAEWQGRRFRCALGRAGVRADKREGDGATPAGVFPLRSVLYRADRLILPGCALPAAAIAESDGWCDDPADPSYNRQVTLPYAGRHEGLWRVDGIYDLIVIVGHNDAPPVPGLGSAIFIHIARPGWEPTEGCVALARDDLIALVAEMTPGDVLVVKEGGAA